MSEHFDRVICFESSLFSYCHLIRFMGVNYDYPSSFDKAMEMCKTRGSKDVMKRATQMRKAYLYYLNKQKKVYEKLRR